MEIGRPSAENVTLGLRPRVTFSPSGSSYFHVPLTTVRNLLNVKKQINSSVSLCLKLFVLL